MVNPQFPGGWVALWQLPQARASASLFARTEQLPHGETTPSDKRTYHKGSVLTFGTRSPAGHDAHHHAVAPPVVPPLVPKWCSKPLQTGPSCTLYPESPPAGERNIWPAEAWFHVPTLRPRPSTLRMLYGSFFTAPFKILSIFVNSKIHTSLSLNGFKGFTDEK